MEKVETISSVHCISHCKLQSTKSPRVSLSSMCLTISAIPTQRSSHGVSVRLLSHLQRTDDKYIVILSRNSSDSGLLGTCFIFLVDCKPVKAADHTYLHSTITVGGAQHLGSTQSISNC